MVNIKKTSAITEYPNILKQKSITLKDDITGLIILILGVLLGFTYFGRLYLPILFSTESTNFVGSFLGLIGFILVLFTILLLILLFVYNIYIFIRIIVLNLRN